MMKFGFTQWQKGFALIAMLALGSMIVPAQAQTYPTKTINMIVPFAAGGPTDTLGRNLALAMSKLLKQQVTIENVGGAGGNIGASRVAKATADGYTCCCTISAWPQVRRCTAPSITTLWAILNISVWCRMYQ